MASETIMLCEYGHSLDNHCVLLVSVVVVMVVLTYLLLGARQANSHMQARCLSPYI